LQAVRSQACGIQAFTMQTDKESHQATVNPIVTYAP
jgi:hypothetical protein